MSELLICTLIAVVLAILLQKRNEQKLRAEAHKGDAIEVMFKNLNTLIEAKSKRSQDVPDEILVLASWMIKSVNIKGIEFILAASLQDGNNTRHRPSPLQSKPMRTELEKVFTDLVHGWVLFVSNKNLFARFLIRNALGKRVVRDERFTPYTAQLVKKVADKKSIHCLNGAAA
ncbi:hypothetical protein [Actibacterium sp. XHP0104]|uniref:hypothetical protein n=1 Tax=Actibacterium sp. XHP0104 TaxID=2984335 RepID=UPI0021E72292|nr:hypothetical protein [Actibacterium sp. XHP0104]MCV2880560.1 hypothetical protein [Actibacterium sp. XHP0104]